MSAAAAAWKRRAEAVAVHAPVAAPSYGVSRAVEAFTATAGTQLPQAQRPRVESSEQVLQPSAAAGGWGGSDGGGWGGGRGYGAAQVVSTGGGAGRGGRYSAHWPLSLPTLDRNPQTMVVWPSSPSGSSMVGPVASSVAGPPGASMAVAAGSSLMAWPSSPALLCTETNTQQRAHQPSVASHQPSPAPLLQPQPPAISHPVPLCPASWGGALPPHRPKPQLQPQLQPQLPGAGLSALAWGQLQPQLQPLPQLPGAGPDALAWGQLDAEHLPAAASMMWGMPASAMMLDQLPATAMMVDQLPATAMMVDHLPATAMHQVELLTQQQQQQQRVQQQAQQQGRDGLVLLQPATAMQVEVLRQQQQQQQGSNNLALARWPLAVAGPGSVEQQAVEVQGLPASLLLTRPMYESWPQAHQAQSRPPYSTQPPQHTHPLFPPLPTVCMQEQEEGGGGGGRARGGGRSLAWRT